jgi:hypothetical protein
MNSSDYVRLKKSQGCTIDMITLINRESNRVHQFCVHRASRSKHSRWRGATVWNKPTTGQPSATATVAELLLRREPTHHLLGFPASTTTRTRTPPKKAPARLPLQVSAPHKTLPPPLEMLLPLRQSLATASSSSSRLRRGLSTVASFPPWAIIEEMKLIKSTAPRAFLEVAEPPRLSRLLVPAHFINRKPRIDSDRASKGLFGGLVRATSGNGHLLIHFLDGPATAADVTKVRAAPKGERVCLKIAADITRFVCNPLSGELYMLYGK